VRLRLPLEDPYPQLEQVWLPAEREWGWTIPTPDLIPDVGILIDLGRPFNPASGPLVMTPRQAT
jgi:hypothetical protein